MHGLLLGEPPCLLQCHCLALGLPDLHQGGVWGMHVYHCLALGLPDLLYQLAVQLLEALPLRRQALFGVLGEVDILQCLGESLFQLLSLTRELLGLLLLLYEGRLGQC